MPLPSDPKVIFLGGLFALALLAIAYVAAEIVLPFVFAITLKLLAAADFAHIGALAFAADARGTAAYPCIVRGHRRRGEAISGPAGTWAAKLPEGIPRLQERLSFLRAPIATLQHFLQQIENIGGTGSDKTLPPRREARLFWHRCSPGQGALPAACFTTVLFLYFLLVSGDIFLRRLVEILPHFSSKRQAVDISQQIESDISAYLVTITIMNAAVGIATGIVMWLTGDGDPILWGTLAFLLNYAPILGPTLGVVIFLLAGLLTIDTLWQALLPAGLYLGHSSDRGRDANADAPGESVHPQSCSRHPVARLLVLDVGYSGRDPLRALAGDHQDHLRPGSAARRAWPLPRGISNASGPSPEPFAPDPRRLLSWAETFGLRLPSRSGCRAAAGQPVIRHGI